MRPRPALDDVGGRRCRVRLPLAAPGVVAQRAGTLSDMAALIDWDLAARTAKRLSPPPPPA